MLLWQHSGTVVYKVFPRRFMEAGGWSVLNVWLSDAKKTQNGPLLAEILQVTSVMIT